MPNAAKELEFILSQHDAKLLAADIYTDPYYEEEPLKTAVLPLNYTEQQLEKFWQDLARIEYDNGYGNQELFGTVWLTDNAWLSREEYDGSEWWEHNQYPQYTNDVLHSQKETDQ
jgi:hypothetical protein